jgi:tRNA(Arg) A34 adenosine deaminase TadA
MRRAIALATENVRTGAGGPFGALIVKDGRVVAEGANRVTATNDPTAHAEVVAIREACRKLSDFQLADCDLYTTCEPCPMCLGAIYWARPDRVFYAATASDAAAAGFDDSFIYEELRRAQADRRIPLEPMMREAGLEPFREWTQKNDRIRY